MILYEKVSNMFSKFFIYLLLVIGMPTVAVAKYYVQASSVKAKDKNFIFKEVESGVFKNESNVRVEKRGDYFSLRIGDFDNKSEAKLALSRIKRIYPDAFIRKGEYHPKRVLPYKNVPKNVSNVKPSRTYQSPKTTYLPPKYED